MSHKQVTISLIIPTYNRAASLKRALESALNLDYPPAGYEIIVVDNGSADATAEVVKNARHSSPGHKLKYVREERLGLHHARHAGVWAAEGDILIFTDDDATFDPGWVRAYAEAEYVVVAGADRAFAYGAYEVLNGDHVKDIAEADQGGRDRDHRHQPRRAQAFQESNETLHQPPPGIRTQDSYRGPTGQLLPRGWFPYG